MENSRSVRLRAGVTQFIKFGIVGGSGVVVNVVVAVLANLVLRDVAGKDVNDVFANLFGTDFNLRWYHIMSSLAFFAANLWNYQLNRWWTFKRSNTQWLRGYLSFLAAGILAWLIQLIVITVLMNPESPLALPSDIFDNSTGFRTKYYYANIIGLLVATPVSFIVNKLWTFRTPATRIVEHVEPQCEKEVSSSTD